MPIKRREEHVHITHHFDDCFVDLLRDFFHSFTNRFHHLEKIIMASNAELQQALTDIGNQADKAKAEIVQRIAALEEALANAGNTTPEVDAAVEALKGKVQALDDLHADV